MVAEEFGQYLSIKRKENNLSIYRLSKESGVSHSYISQLERGVKEEPSPDILKKLAVPLGVDYEEMMQRAGYTKEPKSQVMFELYKELEVRIGNLAGDNEGNNTFPKHVKGKIEKSLGDIFGQLDLVVDCTPSNILDVCRTKHDIGILLKVVKILRQLDGTNTANATGYVDLIFGNQLAIDFNTMEPKEMTDEEMNGWSDSEALPDAIKEIIKIAKEAKTNDELDSIHVESSIEHIISKYTLFSRKKAQHKELKTLLSENDFTYNGNKLTDPDCQRILIMLEQLFPDRQ